jgi:hypothetical protein
MSLTTHNSLGRVLLVNPSVVGREIIAYLGRLGWAVHCANGLAEAVRLLPLECCRVAWHTFVPSSPLHASLRHLCAVARVARG